MEIEFTEPVGDMAEDAGQYSVATWTMEPQYDYGAGSKVDHHPLNVTDVQVSPDRMKVYLEIDGLETGPLGYVVYIRLGSDYASQEDGELLWSTQAWYTLKNFGTGEPFAINGCTDPGYEEYDPAVTVDDGSCQTPASAIKTGSVKSQAGTISVGSPLSVSISEEGRHTVQVLSLKGEIIASRTGFGKRNYTFHQLHKRTIYALRIIVPEKIIHKKIILF
jgi:hypothetical protein